MSILVGRAAPDFRAPAVLGNGEIVDEFHFAETCAGSYALLVFYPLDFTFVCPSELIALQHRLAAFKERDVLVVGVSVDSHYTHHAWRQTPLERGGIGELGYPLVADISHRICRDYGVEAEAGVALRATFLIDRAGTVRHQVVNDLPLGRSMDEALRMVDALRHVEEHGEVCPAGWQVGKAAMKTSPQGVAEFLAAHATSL